MERWIIIRFEGSGFHRWKDAPDKYEFLRHPHHHIFRVTCRIEVTHPERAIEFIDAATRLRAWFQQHLDVGFFAEASCETMAERIALQATSWWHLEGAVEVEVTEDGIHGGGYGKLAATS